MEQQGALSFPAIMRKEYGIPREIQIRGKVTEAIFGGFCKKVGIRLKVVKSLPVIDNMLEEMVYML